jgi:hypothetical protein
MNIFNVANLVNGEAADDLTLQIQAFLVASDRLEQILSSPENNSTPIHILTEALLFQSLSRLQIHLLSYEDRIRYWRPKTAHLIIQILKEENHLDRTYIACWDVLLSSIKLNDRLREDPTEQVEDTMDFGVEIGMIEVLGQELKRNPLRTNILFAALIPLTNFCLCERYVQRFEECDLIKSLISIVRRLNEVHMNVCLLSLIGLTNISLHTISHRTLRENGALEVAAGLLRYLSSANLQELDLGLSSAFLIARVAGRDEVGEGMEYIQANETLISKLHWILDEVLSAGSGGVVLGSQ